MSSVDQTASKLMSFMPQDGTSNAYLLVLDDDRSSIFHLPRSGAIVIGRDAEVDLKVGRDRENTHVSRRHATIRMEASGLHIADLNSKHGTRLNGEPVTQSRTLASGDVISVGEVVLVLHFSMPIAPARAAYGEADWRRRLVEELARAVTFQRPLAVVALAGAAPAAFNDALRLIDVVGTGPDGQSLLLLPEADREQALELAKRVVAAVPEARAGLAICPADACDADTILLAARSAARRAKPGTVACASDEGTVVSLGAGHDVLIADPAMKRVYALLERLAPSELSILINGETGVGKEYAAEAVHHWSKRTGPFLPKNCAGITESLAESELFGYEKGAFTGATATKPGLFEAAAGGTLFLDEVGDLPLAIQAKLLRVLEVKKVMRVGDTRERPIDVRIVAATNKSLDVEVAAGRFRQDLMFRLSGATVVLPPLRDRLSEIPLPARAFPAKFRAGMTITPAAMQILLTHCWDGNVRELKRAMEYAATAPDDSVEPSDLPEDLVGAPSEPPPPPPPPVAPPTGFRPLAEEIEELERRRIREALEAAGGVKTRAADLIKMPIRTFTNKLKEYGM